MSQVVPLLVVIMLILVIVVSQLARILSVLEAL